MLILKNKRTFIIFFLSIFFLTLFVFSPSLSHVSRGDHRVYLIETSDMETLPELIGKTYALNRTRQLDPGDQLLFRPLLYIFMAFELYFFEYNFFAWQLTGLILHILVLIGLWRLLNTIWPSILSSFFVLFFSVLHISQDAVIWHHINGYLLFLIFFLEALRNLLLFFSGHCQSRALRRKTIVLFVLASFLNEFVVIMCIISFLVVFLRNIFAKDKKFVIQRIFIIPIAIFFACNIIDLFVHIDFIPLGSKEINLSLGLIGKAGYVMLLAFMFPFIPDMLNIHESRRVFMSSLDLSEIFNNISFHSVFVIGETALFSIFVFLLLGALAGIVNKESWENKMAGTHILLFGLASLCSSFLYILLLFIAREPHPGFMYLRKSLYHFYPVVLFQFIAIYCLTSYLDIVGFLSRRKKKILILLLCCSALLNARQTYRLNREIKIKHDKIRANGQISNRQWYQKTKELVIAGEYRH